MVFASLGAFYDRMIRLAERIVGGRFVTAKILLAALAIGLFFSFPNYQRLYSKDNLELWVGLLEKCDDPLMDMTRKYESIRHESKLNFRLTVPIVAKSTPIRSCMPTGSPSSQITKYNRQNAASTRDRPLQTARIQRHSRVGLSS